MEPQMPLCTCTKQVLQCSQESCSYGDVQQYWEQVVYEDCYTAYTCSVSNYSCMCG